MLRLFVFFLGSQRNTTNQSINFGVPESYLLLSVYVVLILLDFVDGLRLRLQFMQKYCYTSFRNGTIRICCFLLLITQKNATLIIKKITIYATII